ncbi:hypothetical protein F0726_00825 [Acidithiobacillus caldus]|nr:hypothetical protein F0726_00825 [Acidithiobacillus caldus]
MDTAQTHHRRAAPNGNDGEAWVVLLVTQPDPGE